MKNEYDFSNAGKNPYIPKLPKQQVPIRLDSAIVAYFKDMAEKKGIPYQNIINLYLTDCMLKKKELTVSFE